VPRETESPHPITGYLAEDHDRLDALLARAVADPGAFDAAAFAEFRAGLLRHIGIEEKVLLPAARAARGGEPLEEARRLRIEHGALAALLVPTPTAALVEEIRSILAPHNAVEEGPAGVYARCETLLAGQAEEVAARVRAYPPVRVAPHADGPRVVRTAADALRVSAMQFERR
jgi:hypothetical protein